jgi:hypothetical protein
MAKSLMSKLIFEKFPVASSILIFYESSISDVTPTLLKEAHIEF